MLDQSTMELYPELHLAKILLELSVSDAHYALNELDAISRYLEHNSNHIASVYALRLLLGEDIGERAAEISEQMRYEGMDELAHRFLRYVKSSGSDTLSDFGVNVWDSFSHIRPEVNGVQYLPFNQAVDTIL